MVFSCRHFSSLFFAIMLMTFLSLILHRKISERHKKLYRIKDFFATLIIIDAILRNTYNIYTNTNYIQNLIMTDYVALFILNMINKRNINVK